MNNATLLVNHAGTISFPANISGSGTLAQAGPGQLILTGANSYTGNTIISGGTLALVAANALPTNATLTLQGTASTVFDLAGFSQQLNALTVGGGDSSSQVIYNSSLYSQSILSIAGDTSFGGVLSDAGSKAGTLGLEVTAGNVQLSGPNTYNGGTTVDSGGTLQVNDGGTVGTSAVGNIITNNGTLIFNHSNSITPGVIIQGSEHSSSRADARAQQGRDLFRQRSRLRRNDSVGHRGHNRCASGRIRR